LAAVFEAATGWPSKFHEINLPQAAAAIESKKLPVESIKTMVPAFMPLPASRRTGS
jgi:hypothetical protein